MLLEPRVARPIAQLGNRLGRPSGQLLEEVADLARVEERHVVDLLVDDLEASAHAVLQLPGLRLAVPLLGDALLAALDHLLVLDALSRNELLDRILVAHPEAPHDSREGVVVGREHRLEPRLVVGVHALVEAA
eukprot:scaffold33_cov135-Pinguiococcus_pyrenoidosus.AAC.1